MDKSTIRQARSSQVARKDNGSRQKSPNDKQKCKKKSRSLYKVKIALKGMIIESILILH